jgi:hypothetical protein
MKFVRLEQNVKLFDSNLPAPSIEDPSQRNASMKFEKFVSMGFFLKMKFKKEMPSASYAI